MEITKKTINETDVSEGNFAIVRDNDIGNILFGCPPEIVKYFNRESEIIPANIVVPKRTFRKGKNYFELEFIAYNVIFFKQGNIPINIICKETQERRVRVILRESLFGPEFKNIFESLLMKSLGKFDGFEKHLYTFTEHIGDNKNIFLSFKKIISNSPRPKEVFLKMLPIICKHLKKKSGLSNFIHGDLERVITKTYVKAAMLKLEMNVFAKCSDEEYRDFLNGFVKFHHFDLEGKVVLTGNNGIRCEIVQKENGNFKIYKKGKFAIDSIFRQKDINTDRIEIANKPFDMPELGITFVGAGTGFDPDTYTSCFVIWINGKGIVVDLVADCENHFRRLGFSSNDINHIFLSHLHADHDAGIIEKILIGEKNHILTSRVIFDSFLRKAEALTNFEKEILKDFVSFTCLEEGKEIKVPGIERAYITFDYAFHSIPSGRFKLRYKCLDGKEVLIGFSGDTKYDTKLVDKLHKDGVITTNRRKKILGFLWDCDVIIHEAGEGDLHTNIKELSALPQRLKKKCILMHTNEEIRKTKGFHFAREGETTYIIKQKHHDYLKNAFPLVKSTGVFPKFTTKRFASLVQNKSTNIKTFYKGQYIFEQQSIGDEFYIILSGFAEVIKDGKVIAVYDRGCFFGELAIINKDKLRKASIMAKSKLVLLCLERSIYIKFNLSTTIQERMYEFGNYFAQWMPSSLVGYLSRGELVNFCNGDNIITIYDTSKEVYLLISGEVDIVDAKGDIVAHISDVDILGEIAFFKQVSRTATVKVSTRVASALRLDNKLFEQIYGKFPSFYATVIKKMDRRIRSFEKPSKQN